MRTIRLNKAVSAGQLYEELIAAVPELAPTPTGPDGRLEAQVLIEQAGPRTVLIHVPDLVDTKTVAALVLGHQRQPERNIDPKGDALRLLQARADAGDEVAQAYLVLLG